MILIGVSARILKNEVPNKSPALVPLSGIPQHSGIQKREIPLVSGIPKSRTFRDDKGFVAWFSTTPPASSQERIETGFQEVLDGKEKRSGQTLPFKPLPSLALFRLSRFNISRNMVCDNKQRDVVPVFLIKDVVGKRAAANNRYERPCFFLHLSFGARLDLLAEFQMSARKTPCPAAMGAFPQAKKNLVSFADDDADTDLWSVIFHKFSST